MIIVVLLQRRLRELIVKVIEKTLKAYWCVCRDDDAPYIHDHDRIAKGITRMDTAKVRGEVIDPVNFTPMTISGVLPKEFALELVRRYKEVIAPHFDSAMKVVMFGSYAKGHPHEWSDIDVAVIVPKVDKDNWRNTAVSLNRAVDSISCYIEPILLENDEDTPIYREVMRTGIVV